MVERGPPLRRTLAIALLGLTLVLTVIAVLSVGDLLDARQRYEDALARSYQLEAVSARLLAVGVLEEAALGRADRGGARARRRARDVFEGLTAQARALAADDPRSEALVQGRAEAQRRTRALARVANTRQGRTRLAAALRDARRDNRALVARQEQRRDEARARTRDDTRGALVIAGIAGGLALLAAVVLVGALLTSIRRPVDDLVGATRRLGSGRLDERVEPSGPEELRDLGGAFNRMAEDLGAAQDEEQRRSYLAMVRALTNAVEARDAYTGKHAERVAAYGLLLTRRLDPELADDPQTEFGFLLHDVGKVATPDQVLHKPDYLREDESEVMRRHVVIGWEILSGVPYLDRAAKIVRAHHEHWDGSGYPDGLAGEKIPLAARIFAVADTLDALTTDRPYRDGVSIAEAVEIIEDHAGTQFDPAVVEELRSTSVESLEAIRSETMVEPK